MRNFLIYTDDTCDLPEETIKKLGVKVIPMEFMIDNKVYSSSQVDALSPKELYSAMRENKKTSTSQIPPQTYTDIFSGELAQGKDVLYLAFSSGLSGSCNSAVLAQTELAKLFPNNKLVIVDSLCACLGEGMFVYKVASFASKKTITIEETAEYAKNLVQKVCHLFTVDDLNFLHRGGRLSKASAILGTLLHLKPVMHISEEGKIVPIAKVIGRNKSLLALVDQMAKNVLVEENDVIMIGHGDCANDAEFVAQKITEKFGIKTFIINYIGTVIGSHSGPGTIALFYIGKSRAV